MVQSLIESYSEQRDGTIVVGVRFDRPPAWPQLHAKINDQLKSEIMDPHGATIDSLEISSDRCAVLAVFRSRW